MFPLSKTLSEETDAVAVATTGTSYKVSPSDLDGVPTSSQAFKVSFELVLAGGGTPTLDAKVQTSWDGSTWHDVATMTQATAVGDSAEIKDVTVMGRYARSVVTPGGSGTYTGRVALVSNGHFSAKKA